MPPPASCSALAKLARCTSTSLRKVIRAALALPPNLANSFACRAVSESENLVYLRKEGAAGFDGIQSLEDLRNNWNRLIDAAGLTADERREAVGLFNSKVEKMPGTDVR